MEVWQTMKRAIDEGLQKTGGLPGGLNVQPHLFEKEPEEDIPALKEFQFIAAFAYAVAEQNADNGAIVTAPPPVCFARSTEICTGHPRFHR